MRAALSPRDLAEEPLLPMLLSEAGRAKRAFPWFEVWELVSIGWLGLHRARKSYDPSRGDLAPYAQVHIRGVIIDEARKSQRNYVPGAPIGTTAKLFPPDAIRGFVSEEEADRQAIANEEKVLLWDAIETLSPRQKGAVVQYYFEDRDAGEMEVMGRRGVDYVSDVLRVARRNIRQRMRGA